jgi:hypothetical protein
LCELDDAAVLAIADGGEAIPTQPWWADLDDTVVVAKDGT